MGLKELKPDACESDALESGGSPMTPVLTTKVLIAVEAPALFVLWVRELSLVELTIAGSLPDVTAAGVALVETVPADTQPVLTELLSLPTVCADA